MFFRPSEKAFQTAFPFASKPYEQNPNARRHPAAGLPTGRLPVEKSPQTCPRRTKFRKQHRPHRTGLSKGGNQIAFGEYGIQALEPAYITNRQIEAARIAMTRHIKRGGKVWITVFPDRPLTKKPAETRMGSGKGAPEWWIANVKPGRILFELGGVDEALAREAMRRAQHKLPMKTRFVTREGGDV